MATKTKSTISKKEQFADLLLQVNNDLAITNTLDEALEALVGITTSIISVNVELFSLMIPNQRSYIHG